MRNEGIASRQERIREFYFATRMVLVPQTRSGVQDEVSNSGTTELYEPYLDVRTLLQVNAVNEPHLAGVQGHNYGGGSRALTEKPHALQ